MKNIFGLEPGFKFVDFFAGMGGFRTGMQQAGGIGVFACEIDPHASRSYELLYGEKPTGDIRKVDAKDVPDHDILCGGFPCQAFSVAGKKLGFKDQTRGTLFFEIIRIADEKKPKILFLENVKGLVNHDKGKTLDVIIQALSDIGYTVDFQVLNSKYFGVPQNRERIFIVAVRDLPTEPYTIPKRKTVVSDAKKRFNGIGTVRSFNFGWPTNDKVETSIRDVLEDDVDEKFYLSKEKTSKLIAALNEKNNGDIKNIGYIERTSQGNRVYAIDGISPTITSQGGGIGGHGAGVYAVPSSDDENQVILITDKRGGNTLHSWDFGLHGQVTDSEKRILELIVKVRRAGGKEEAVTANQIGTTKAVLDKLAKMGYLKKVGNKYDFSLSTMNFDVTRIIPSGGVSPTLTSTDADRNGVVVSSEDKMEECKMLGLLDMKGSDQSRRVYHPDGLAPTLTTMGGGNTQPKIAIDGHPEKTREFSEGDGVACCLDANYSHGISPNSIGKGRRTHIVEQITEVRAVLTPDRVEKRQNGRRFKEDGEPAFTVTSQDIHGVAVKYEGYQEDPVIINTRVMGDPLPYSDVSPTLCATDYKEPKLVHKAWRIRKLTPLECFRLQGFPDRYVAILTRAGMSNTQLYKMAGNAVTVNVIHAIASAILGFNKQIQPQVTNVIAAPVKESTPANDKPSNIQVVSTKPTSLGLDKSSSLIDLVKEWVSTTKTNGRYSTTELYNEIKGFASKKHVDADGLSNAIYFGTVLGKNINKLTTLGVKISKGTKWNIAV